MNLKNITLEKIKNEWNSIKTMNLAELENISERSKLGCDIVDYYFFEERLKTKGNKGINFYEFVNNIEYYKTKKYIQTLLSYCETHNRYTGKYFIAIDDIKNKEPLLKLEKILFYGKGHLKRGGLTLFPPKLLKNTEYLEWLKELLKEHLVTYNLSKEIPHC